MASFLIVLLLLCPILFIGLSLYKFFIQKATVVKGNLSLPPGGKGWPFVGEVLHYIYHIYKGTTVKFVEIRMKKYNSKIFSTSFAGQPIAILCGPEGNKFLFSNEKKLVTLWLPPIIDQLFPKSRDVHNIDESIRLRGMLSLFLKGETLRKSVGVLDSEMKQHLQSEWRNETVQVSSMAKKYTFGLSCKLFLSINDPKTIDEFGKLIDVVADALHSVSINIPGTALYRGIKASKTLRKELEKIVKQRRIDLSEKSCISIPQPQDMITQMLLNEDKNGKFLNEFDIASHSLGLIQAAYASLHNTITIIMMYLSEYPDVYENVLREQMEVAESKEPNELLTYGDLSRMKYTWNVMSEVLRILPPLGAFREAITDLEYDGYLIPKGWKMHWISHTTHNSPKYFKDPEKFDPTRFEGNGPAPYTYVPFGGGPRMCPGNEYARLVIFVFVHNVVTKFKWKKLIPNEKLIHGPVSHPAFGLPIHVYPLKS